MCYSFGQACSLVLADLGLTGFDLLFTDMIGLLLVFVIAVHSALNKLPLREFQLLLFVYGLLHGLAYAQELTTIDLAPQQKLPALFMFNLAVDLGHVAIAMLFFITLYIFRKSSGTRVVLAYGIGVLSVVMMLIHFKEHVITGQASLLKHGASQLSTQYTLPASPTPQQGGGRPKGARRMTSPVMSYLSVEPFEVRQEILIQARAAVQFMGVDHKGKGSIHVDSQDQVKESLLTLIQKANPVTIDGQPAGSILSRADFVTLGPAGVILRPEPVPESLDDGILGLTLVYKTADLANNIEIDWRLFSDSVRKVEATTADPFGGSSMILTPENSKLQWKIRLSGYKVPVIEKLAVEKPKLPVISALLFIGILLFVLLSQFKKRYAPGRPVLLSVAALGFVLYPFARFPVDLPLVGQWEPSAERTAIILDGLLTNVYRSFDVRDESDVYDRLAVSVTGPQLTQIYLENRQSLELENRGGARANVDEVEILDVNRVKAAPEGGFTADAAWTVSGSVNHFGHTHYRRNRYHALVNFIVDNDAWKIKEIELIDEERLL